MGFVENYTSRQKDAVVHACLDAHVRPAERVCELAAAGELQYVDEPVEAFQVAESTVRSLAAQARRRRRRRGEVNSSVANAADPPPGSAG